MATCCAWTSPARLRASIGARQGRVLHQNTDNWRSTTPMDGPSPGAWPVAGAWLMTALYERYRFSGDDADLRRIYPLLCDQTRFLLDIPVKDPKRGWRVTAPSNSPENFPAPPDNGVFFDEVRGSELTARTMTAGLTMDMQVIREVFAIFDESARCGQARQRGARRFRDARDRCETGRDVPADLCALTNVRKTIRVALSPQAP